MSDTASFSEFRTSLTWGAASSALRSLLGTNSHSSASQQQLEPRRHSTFHEKKNFHVYFQTSPGGRTRRQQNESTLDDETQATLSLELVVQNSCSTKRTMPQCFTPSLRVFWPLCRWILRFPLLNRSVSPPKTRKTTVTLLTGIIYTETWSGRKVGHYQQSKGNIFESHSSFLPHHNFSCTMFKKHIDVNCSCQKERMFLALLMY